MANLRRERVRYGTALPNNGVFDGELFVLVVAGSDNQLYMWNANDDAWEPVAGDSAALVAASLTLSGNATITGTLGVTGNATLSGANTSTGLLTASAGILLGPSTVNELRSDTVVVTATQIRTMAASPVELVPAPAAGKALMFHWALLQYRGGANAFDSVGAGEDLAIRYTNGSGAITSRTIDTTTDLNLGVTTDANVLMRQLQANTVPVAAAALVLDNVGAGELAAADDDANGDGTITVEICYSIITLAA